MENRAIRGLAPTPSRLFLDHSKLGLTPTQSAALVPDYLHYVGDVGNTRTLTSISPILFAALMMGRPTIEGKM